MANRKLDKLLAKATRAYEKDERRKGSRLVKEILQQDFQHDGAWKLLYRTYGGERSFKTFQREFAAKYYPEKSHLLEESAQGEAELLDASGAQEAKPSLFARLFGALRRKPQSTPSTTSGTPVHRSKKGATKAQPFAPAPTKSPAPLVNRVALQPARQDSAAEPEHSSTTIIASQAPASPISGSAPAYAPPPARRVAHGANDSEKIRVLVVDDIDLTRENVIRALRFEEHIDVVDVADNGAQAIEMALAHDPDVVVMDVNMPDMDGISATAQIRRRLPATQVIILTVQDDIDYMRQAMMAGARDFLTKPPMIDELVTAVENAYKYTREEREKAAPVVPAGMVGADGGLKKGRVITVYSPRGGAGCSLLSANLAASLYDEETPVVLVDADLQFGDLPVLFNIQSTTSLLDLTRRADELDGNLLQEVLVEHSSGIRLLAPPRPEYAEQINSDGLSKTLDFMRRHYPYVIVDTHHRIEDVSLAAFESSDLVILVTTQDIPSIARMRRFLTLYDLLRFDPQRLFTVMNQYDPRMGIHADKVGETIRHKITMTIPRETGVVIPSINRGTPFVLQNELRGRPVVQALNELARAVCERITQLEEAEALAAAEPA